MKIVSASQTHKIDEYTISHEPVTSIDLMERAATTFCEWFMQYYFNVNRIKIVCGPGNNGGDGLAIARILHSYSYKVDVYTVLPTEKTSKDFDINLQRLPSSISVQKITSQSELPQFHAEDIIIDALFGSGLNRPLDGLAADIVQAINQAKTIIAVDIPSGLFTDTNNSKEDVIIKASQTIAFQLPKLSFMLPQNAEFVGDWHLVDIGLHPTAIAQASTNYFYTDTSEAIIYLKKRSKFSHKGSNGHALLIAGSYGMMGAAILSAQACLRSGAGKLTLHAPKHANDLIQSTIPEALFSADPDEYLSTTEWTEDMLKNYSAIGIGPGLSVGEKILFSIHSIIEHSSSIPLIIDADGINNLSTPEGRPLLEKLPANTILTPHPKEFQKLLNRSWQNDYEKLDLLREFSVKHQVIVCLKGAHTAVALTDGSIHFNSTGNPGMGTGGSGDVLTGIITALLAQKYSPTHAAIFGVYLHGLAGDIAAKEKSIYAMIASDLTDNLPKAFLAITDLSTQKS
ncbi:NAD(P)H-hydrate dehydratase [Cytophagaceae bacterium YF14B1]|uniref:Bifunctional NAD(P)H-hydrate repair enzyme n=1 Tax=Xanthocytophaga flava TaxID=3048013 RepID=A0AAE3QKT9_9BACT|nr:NAD(P)H-hydrate dehydratase [Xanthocytophaga flavus]MDJ1478915.1 NAD(P)H-hydrate dehydratase [Xanthocytophaga flavus]